MSILKRLIASILIIILALQIYPLTRVFAYDFDTVHPPEKLRVEALNNNEPAIGYNEYDNYYIDLKWDAVTFTQGTGYYNLYIQEVEKYGIANTYSILERDLTQGTRQMRVKNLKPGTVYYFYIKAYSKVNFGSVTASSPESIPSNTVRILTDISISAGPPMSSSQIRIVWDDVWNTGGRRIDYKLYVAEDSNFSNVQPIYIGQQQIEPTGPVSVDRAAGKLTYIHTVRDAGKVYYVKIVPDISDVGLKKNDETETVCTSTYILVKTTRVANTYTGDTIWRLDWNPIVTGLGSNNVKVSYLIYKGVSGSNALPDYMASVEGDTSFFVTIPKDEENSYYLIRATVKLDNGSDVYPIDITSQMINVKDQDVPYSPPIPEIVNSFENSSGDIIVSYGGQLEARSATILWKAPKMPDGNPDTDTLYDIWLITDPNQIDNPPSNTRIAASLQITDLSTKYLVQDGSLLLGYRYDLEDLSPNSTYYFKIVARKTFTQYSNGLLENVTYTSQAAYKIIITPADGSIDQPIVPAAPPFKIKQSLPPESKYQITQTTATVQLKNKWYEKFNTITGAWEYVRTEKLSPSDTTVPYNPITSPPNGITYRKVEYDSGVTIDVGCIKYVNGMTYNDLETIPADKIIGVPVTANDPDEVASLNPDRIKHNINITLTDLEPNTAYIVWIRAARRITNQTSGPSDPLIITTNPDISSDLEKPTVPVINYNLANDTYIDLGWDIKQGYNYYIKYSTEDDISSADSNDIAVMPEDLTTSNFYRIAMLKPNTLYFFWIQAEVTDNSGRKAQSEWSDSLPVKTLPEIPPDTPRGFGVKNSADAVDKNSITYEWVASDGLEYILEVADDTGFSSPKTYTAGKVSQFKIDDLRSNYRYYARLYAYDPDKKLRSKPTQIVSVITKRSNDDYDADQDIDNFISGEFIVKDPTVVNYSWTVRITGLNADRFAEHVQTDNAVDYTLDLSMPPSMATIYVIQISDKVFKAMTGLKENLVIATGNIKFIIRPGMFPENPDSALLKGAPDINYEIRILSPDSAADDYLQKIQPIENMAYKTEITKVEVTARSGSISVPVKSFSKPLKVIYTYNTAGWFLQGVTTALALDQSLMEWNKLDTSAVYDPYKQQGFLSCEVSVPTRLTVADLNLNTFYDEPGHWAENAIGNVASVHNLKSMKDKLFQPDNDLTAGEAVKLAFDVLDTDNDNNYMTVAARAGIISYEVSLSPGSFCTREAAIAMAVRIYEIKTGETAAPSSSSKLSFTDMSQVNIQYVQAVRFALENGIYLDDGANMILPETVIKRGEFMVLIEKTLMLAGEL